MPHEVSAHFAAKLRIFQHITSHFPFFILLFAHLALPLRLCREDRLRFGKESKKLRVLLCFSLTLHYL
jgi:hypothetical protein